MRGLEGKVVVLGSRGVGKTSLITKYVKNSINKDNGPTIGASLYTCKVILDDFKVKLQIWDTAGQERFKAVAPMYYRNACAAILVFDLTQAKTLSEIRGWIQELHRNVQDPIQLTLVGNKLDLHDERKVSRNEAHVFAASIGATYFETSAESAEGLEQIFFSTARRLVNEGKSRSMRQFDSCDSILAYSNQNTAFSHTSAALANKGRIILPAVDHGIPVEDDDVRTNAEGRLEMPSWSIEHIALGESIVSRCCF